MWVFLIIYFFCLFLVWMCILVHLVRASVSLDISWKWNGSSGWGGSFILIEFACPCINRISRSYGRICQLSCRHSGSHLQSLLQAQHSPKYSLVPIPNFLPKHLDLTSPISHISNQFLSTTPHIPFYHTPFFLSRIPFTSSLNILNYN